MIPILLFMKNWSAGVWNTVWIGSFVWIDSFGEESTLRTPLALNFFSGRWSFIWRRIDSFTSLDMFNFNMHQIESILWVNHQTRFKLKYTQNPKEKAEKRIEYFIIESSQNEESIQNTSDGNPKNFWHLQKPQESIQNIKEPIHNEKIWLNELILNVKNRFKIDESRKTYYWVVSWQQKESSLIKKETIQDVKNRNK